jgi:hypothetical protein
MARVSLKERQTAKCKELSVKLAESVQRYLGVDPRKIPWGGYDASVGAPYVEFSIQRLKENFDTPSVSGNLREANSETAFGQLLRYGVQHFMFDAYASVTDFIYPDIVTNRPSKNRQEWYAPLYGVEVPKDVPLGGKFEDSRIQGLDVEVVNKKVGRLLTLERELVDDDQTGQIAQKASELGERMRYKEEADVLGVDFFTLSTLGNGLTGVSGASYSYTLFGTWNSQAYGNRPQTFAPLAQPGLEFADISLHQATDPMGNRIMVRPSKLVASPADKFNAAKLLNSSLQPSVPGASGQTFNTATSGLTGFVMTVNPLQGLYDLKISRFMPPLYWYLMDPRSIVFQDRDPFELLMEARDAGASFDRDEYRYRARRRYQVAVIDYRFIFCGNGQ